MARFSRFPWLDAVAAAEAQELAGAKAAAQRSSRARQGRVLCACEPGLAPVLGSARTDIPRGKCPG